jgi:DMSO/TMAO reductase YedYZ molybdopterin-dependent catalytic subunit
MAEERGIMGKRWFQLTVPIVILVGAAAFVYFSGGLGPRHYDTATLHVTGGDVAGRISDPAAYRLRVWGKVNKELSLTLQDIKAMPTVQTDAPLECVVEWTDRAMWEGVPIRDVIRLAGPQADGKFLVFRDDRDFSSSLSMDYVQTGKPILAWKVNGADLPRDQGWPIRVVAPDKWAYKWVKWVTQIEVTDRGYEGSYESAGFSLDGDLNKPRTQQEVEQDGHKTVKPRTP